MHDVNDRWRAVRERLKGWKERFLHQVGTAHPAAWLTLAAAFMFAVVFGSLGVQNHRNFGTWSYDMGIYDQAIWLMSRGQSFMSVRGMNVWGHHFNPVLLLFAPFYWFGAGPEFLYVVQACALAAAAVPIYLIARDKFKTDPVLIVEVLSPSTAAYDLGNKFASYRLIPTLQHAVFIDPESRRIDHFQREGDRWVLLPSGVEHLELPALDCRIATAERSSLK